MSKSSLANTNMFPPITHGVTRPSNRHRTRSLERAAQKRPALREECAPERRDEQLGRRLAHGLARFQLM
ncbi:hypothetical protein CesoFtcFv8_013444 [Champsocephalus esox]|uniref:Uncharacterized protein n=1 Tax=Champsocephalus esox TaxID=159716 RepID=A0AAN8GTQ0_9TELE|nr:hypothetical protein CesoFtcFv8_013444 [Champsocephalus esox]